MARVLIGTSGWHYDSWRGPFFPRGLPLKDQLPYYASQFCSTELNGVFYRTPILDAVRAWRAQTGRDSVFAWTRRSLLTLSHRETVMLRSMIKDAFPFLPVSIRLCAQTWR